MEWWPQGTKPSNVDGIKFCFSIFVATKFTTVFEDSEIDVSGDLKVGGEVQVTNIGYTDGDNAIVIADGGGITASVSVNIAGDGATVTGIKDEDDMSSNSNVKLATQQSIKAYADTKASTGKAIAMAIVFG